MTLQRTCERNADLEKEEELAQLQHQIATHPSPISIDPEDNILSKKQLSDIRELITGSSYEFKISGRTITRQPWGDKRGEWLTSLFKEPISEGVISVAFTVLAMPDTTYAEVGLMFGIVDALSRERKDGGQLGCNIKNSIAIAPRSGILLVALPSTKHKVKGKVISTVLDKEDRVVLEVDMDARPRTAVFIINGNVSLTFVSGLPPSIRIGYSMQNKRISIRFDGLSRLKEATPLQRMNEIKWNPSHFRMEDKIITTTGVAAQENHYSIYKTPIWSSFFLSEPISEGIVAVSFTFLTEDEKSRHTSFGLIDGTSQIPEIGQALGQLKNSISLSQERNLYFLTTEGQQTIDLSSFYESGDHVIVEINMDSNPRTAQFFVDRQSAYVVVIDLPESVRVGFSSKDPEMQVRFDRITHLNRGSPITDLMKVIDWPTQEPLQKTEKKEESDEKDEEKRLDAEERKGTDTTDKGRIDDDSSEEKARNEESDEENVQPSQDIHKTNINVVDDGGEDVDEKMNDSESDHENDDDGTGVEKRKRHFLTMKLLTQTKAPTPLRYSP
ncbi:hypothetical protein BLNAU_22584 [Blattamonas nauphoetae]|uniref:Uncharacterized protein n=1 Tax=Blattamonas nauphoetae TaxID=2049346 RepID=A0ABQ9WTR3_9EUKA|nr:hypothetical protein BLNAU_22584 [Blattamonas nauphoetae]